MRYISEEEILLIHHQLIKRYGGSHGTRDLERVKSAAIIAPAQSVFGEEQYKTVFEKAAVYARNIIADHPFQDGNKRTGIAVAAMFLKKNGYKLKAKKGEIENFAVKIAVKKLDVVQIAAWLQGHSRQV
ncbi:type II toxin-antitoxin system death-on-curing family toxin [Candidatus Saccharibacteria bacterium CG10_big_fil_rev_8_21_14_0_10_47_8]|nr:MAG: type II toxin-antitoxin system death-on-curing family toxin [Candidatus Saccharibacteria bacterium CG10_big_fil_rev_8_21_14_0_10_47_8]